MQTKTYSNIELAGFSAELESGYRVHKTISGGHKISYIDFEAYLEAQKAFRKPNTVRDIGRYNELMDKFEQLKRLNSRRDYAKEKAAEQQAAML